MSSGRKILVVGSGGREHALAWRMLESASVAEVVVVPGNAGTMTTPPGLGEDKTLRSLQGDVEEVARAEKPWLVVIGPEAPLCDGVADRLRAAGLVVYGPSAAAAQLEGSKAFMKEFCLRHSIPTALHLRLQGSDDVESAVRSFPVPPVVKADGLCAGKGVVVATTHEEAIEAALTMLSGSAFGDAGLTVVLEERLEGAEASVHVVSDGAHYVVLPVAQDHKRIGDGDQGPNTGGMGTYAPAPLVDDALMARVDAEIIRPTVNGMAADGVPFQGTLFFGLMVAPDGTPKLLEINVRFGDPETQVLLPLIPGDLAELLHQAATGTIAETRVIAASGHALCVVMAAAGYPGVIRRGDPIQGLDDAARCPGVRIYHAGTHAADGAVVVAGGRVLGVTAVGATLQEAANQAYAGVEKIRFSGAQFRRDIGHRALQR